MNVGHTVKECPVGGHWCCSDWKDKDRFFVRAIGDKLLVDGKVRYMGFFEIDEPFAGGPTVLPYQIFPTKNGCHIVSWELMSAFQKRVWFEAWKEYYPRSDYLLNNWNWLHPHTREETKFILTRSKVEPQTVRYFRDKAVVENWQARNRPQSS